jgi:antitoxin CptB
MTNPNGTEINIDTSNETSLADRKVIYRARRGLKELDYYFDSYVREHFLQADTQEKADFSILIDQEDPDLLDWFMNVTPPPDELIAIVHRIKSLKA